MFSEGGFAGFQHYLYWLTQACPAPGGDGTVTAVWHGGARDSGRFTAWIAAWSRSRA